MIAGGKFFFEDRRTKGAGLDANCSDELKYGHDLLLRRTVLERPADMAANAWRVQMGAGCIDRKEQEFNGFPVAIS